MLKDRALEARSLAGFDTVPPWAKKLGVSSAAIYQIENGKTLDLKAATAEGMSRLSGLRAEWIRTGRGAKFPNQVRESATTYRPVSHSAGRDLTTMAAAVELATYWMELQGLAGDVSDHIPLLALTYQIVLEDQQSESPGNVLDLSKKLAARIRKEAADGDQREETAGTGAAAAGLHPGKKRARKT